MKPESLRTIHEAVSGKHPHLLTLEDFIAVYGKACRFHSEVIEEVEWRHELFDEWAKLSH